MRILHFILWLATEPFSPLPCHVLSGVGVVISGQKNDVCGATPVAWGGTCGETVTFQEAQQQCTVRSMRLCASTEIDVSSAPFCSNLFRVWVANSQDLDSCAYGDLQIAGSSSQSGSLPPICSPRAPTPAPTRLTSTTAAPRPTLAPVSNFIAPKARIRCCADEYPCYLSHNSGLCTTLEHKQNFSITDPCYGDPCQSLALGSQNVCVSLAAPYQYTCQCVAPYVSVVDPNHQTTLSGCTLPQPITQPPVPSQAPTHRPSTRRPTSAPTRAVATATAPCASRPCQGRFANGTLYSGLGNRCLPNVNNPISPYTCTCAFGSRWFPTPDQGSCMYVPSPCTTTDPCLIAQGNLCIEPILGQHQCTCMGAYTLGPLAQTCMARINPCAQDPCFSQNGTTGNTCIARGSQSYCLCIGPQWIPQPSPANPLSCKYVPPGVCDSHPCSEDINIHNRCIPTANAPGGYTCACAPWWHGDGSSCEPVPNPCLDSAVCTTYVNSDNTCIPSPDGSYMCICNNETFFASGGAQACTFVPDPCQTDPSPCSMDDNPLNSCTRCSDWVAANPSSASSSTPSNPQPCTAQAFSLANIRAADAALGITPPSQDVNGNGYLDDMADQLDIGSEGIGRIGGLTPYQLSSTFTCTCNLLAGYMPTPDFRGCLVPQRCAAVLAAGDPCRTINHAANRCVDTRGGNYTCVCKSQYWVASSDFQSCVYSPPADPCASTPCGSQYGNTCVKTSDTTYACSCNSPGWLPTGNRQGCAPPAKACQTLDDPCSMQLHGSNVCNDRSDGSYYCDCAPNWQTNAAQQYCLRPANPCLTFGAPACGVTSSNSNFCINNGDGTYKCICLQPGWSITGTAKNCTRNPPTPVVTLSPTRVHKCFTGDPCLRYAFSPNTCTDNPDGSFYCTCVFPWVSALNGQACVRSS